MNKKTAVEIQNLSVFYDKVQALKNISLKIYEGDFLGIMGPNGGGKSTLLKAILGLIPIHKGTIHIFGDNIHNSKGFVGYVPQSSSVDKNFPISALEVVISGMLRGSFHPFFKYKKTDKEKGEYYLKRTGILELKNRQVSELSGGEFQKLLIARALATEPKLLLLDEPTANIAPDAREQIYDLLTELNKNLTIVLVTHDLNAIASSIELLACLNQSLVYHGEPSLTEDLVQKMYGCPVDLIAHGVPHRVLGEHHH